MRAVALRPEAIVLNGEGGARNRINGTIEEVNFLGAVVRIRVRISENSVSLDTFNNPTAPPPKRGDQVVLSFAPEDVLILDLEPGDVGGRTVLG
jgi:putative spermidine/putrescine transport system ATP-binding protein